MNTKLTYLTIIFAGLIRFVNATDYYVNDASLVGDVYCTAIGAGGNNALSPATPKASLQDVISSYALVAGDNVYVDAGSYTETVTATGISGAAGNYISFIGADSSSTIFVPPTAGNDKMFHIDNVHYTLWSNFKIDGTALGDDYGFEIYNDCSYNIVEYFNMVNCYYGMDILRTVNGNPPSFNHFRNSTITADWVGVRIKSNNVAGGWVASSETGPHDNEVYDNKVYLVNSTGTGYSALESQAARHNLWYRNQALADCFALVEGTVHSAHGTTGNSFMNNYLSNMNLGQNAYNCDDSSSVIFIHNSFYSVDVCWQFDAIEGNNINGVILRNNNIESLTEVPIQLNAAGAQFGEVENNLYYSAASTNVARVNGTNYDLAAWQAYDPDVGSGDAQNSIFADPLYLDHTIALLDLMCTSPAINSVVSNVPTIVDDIYKTARPIGIADDIGAHELTNIDAGDVTPDISSICSGDTQSLLSEGMEGIHYSGAVVIWNQSTDAINWVATDGTFNQLTDSTGDVTRTNATLLPDTMYYRVNVECYYADTSDTVMVITHPAPDAGDPILGGAICTPGTLDITMSNYLGDSIYWETRIPGGTWNVITGEILDAITVSPSADSNYRAVIKYSNQVCPADTTNEAQVTITPGPVAGTITGGSICTGSSQLITMVGYSGDSIFWQESPAGLGTWSVVAGESNDNITVSPTADTDYRAVIKFAGTSCAGDTSNIATVNVDPVPTAGTITGGTICPGDNITITISGYAGDSIYWEESPSGAGTWSVMAGESNDNIIVSPAADTDYRAYVKYANGLCPIDVTALATVTVNATVTIGSFTNSPLAYCTGGSGVLNVTAGSGTVTWEESTDGITFGPFTGSGASSTSATVSYTNATAQNDTTWVRLEYTSTCATDYSDTALVIVSPTPTAGTIAGGTICPGDNITITISGYAGDSIYWEESPSGAGTWSVMAGESNDNIIVSPAADTDYRAYVKYANGLCPIDVTALATVTVNATVTTGSFTNSPLAYCTGGSGVLNVTAGSGTVTWEESTDGITFGPFTGSGASSTSATVSYTNASTQNDTTWVRLEYTSTCATDYSDTALVIVSPTPTAGTITGGTICPGDNITITISGYAGDSIYWEESPSGAGTWSVMAGESNDNITVSPAADTDYRAYVKYANGLCPIDVTALATVTVNATVTTGSFTNSPLAYCTGGSGVLNVTAGSGTVTWEESTDGITFGPFTGSGASSTSATVSYTNASTQNDTTWVRLEYTSTCATDYSDTALVIVSPTPAAGTITGGTICLGDSYTFNLTGFVGDSIFWIEDDGSGSVVIPGESSSSLTVNPAIATTYQAVVKYSNGSCPAVFSNIATVDFGTVNPSVSIEVGEVCVEDGLLTASVTSTTDAGSSPTFQWLVNGVNAGTGGTVLSTVVADGDLVSVEMTSSASCASGTVVSNSEVVTTKTCNCELWVPNAISPNDDGANDTWQIQGLGCYDLWTVRVYNRYGSLVWEQSYSDEINSTNLYIPWNGYRNGSPMPVAVYYYVVEATTEFGDNKNLAGSLTIMR